MDNEAVADQDFYITQSAYVPFHAGEFDIEINLKEWGMKYDDFLEFAKGKNLNVLGIGCGEAQQYTELMRFLGEVSAVVLVEPNEERINKALRNFKRIQRNDFQISRLSDIEKNPLGSKKTVYFLKDTISNFPNKLFTKNIDFIFSLQVLQYLRNPLSLFKTVVDALKANDSENEYRGAYFWQDIRPNSYFYILHKDCISSGDLEEKLQSKFKDGYEDGNPLTTFMPKNIQSLLIELGLEPSTDFKIVTIADMLTYYYSEIDVQQEISSVGSGAEKLKIQTTEKTELEHELPSLGLVFSTSGIDKIKIQTCASFYTINKIPDELKNCGKIAQGKYAFF